MADAQTEMAGFAEVMQAIDASEQIKSPAYPSTGKRDGLTGLLSHTCFQIELEHAFQLAQSSGKAVACLVLDIDYFHAINRRFSYAFGDTVLIQIAEVLRRELGKNVALARFSGEQFSASWFPGSLDSALQTSERVRRAIADYRFNGTSQSTYLTVSGGLALSDARFRAAKDVLGACQLVLRSAKREGRNRICYWQREQHAQPEAPGLAAIADLQQKFAEMEREIKAFGTEEIRSLLDDIHIPDGLGDDHAENVAFIAASIADEIGLDEKNIDVIISAALLHDIGKLGIDEGILKKEGPLTPEEFEEIKKHPMLGAEFLLEARFLEKELPLIRHHHEQYDGKGYPDGLKGENIPLGARIISISEALDGLLSGSAYREAHSIKETIAELQRCAGSHFDPKLVAVAINLLESGRIG